MVNFANSRVDSVRLSGEISAASRRLQVQCSLWALNAASASGTSWAGTAITHSCPAAVSRILRKRRGSTQKGPRR
jgi:hypothetical protein